MDRLLRLLPFAALTALLYLPVSAADDATVRITYVTGSSAYLDAGARDGLAAGDRVEVLREGVVIAVLEVSEVSRGKAVCTILERSSELQAGDAARILPRNRPAASPTGGTPADRGEATVRRGTGSGIRGRIGARFLMTRARAGDRSEYSRPSLDLRLDGDRIGGTPWQMAVDVRARSVTVRSNGVKEESDSRTRVYRLALGWDGASSPFRFTAGRQFSPELSAVSIFDGISGSYDSKRWSVGGFTGTQPDPVDYAYSTDLREHGLYFQYRARREGSRRWRLTTGLVGSYQDSEVDREFLYFQGRYTGPRLSMFATEEVDYNRGWKKEAGEDTLSPTSTFIHFNLRAGDRMSFRGGFDNRRNVRLYRFRVTPETEFDDSYRRGTWLGTSVRFHRKFRAGIDVRNGNGGSAGSADSVTLTASAHGITGRNLSLHGRSTRYTNDRLEGWLHSVAVGSDLGARLHLQAHGGIRAETGVLGPALDDDIVWYGLDADVSLGRHWYLLLTAERSDGDLEEYDQFHAGLTYRF